MRRRQPPCMQQPWPCMQMFSPCNNGVCTTCITDCQSYQLRCKLQCTTLHSWRTAATSSSRAGRRIAMAMSQRWSSQAEVSHRRFCYLHRMPLLWRDPSFLRTALECGVMTTAFWTIHSIRAAGHGPEPRRRHHAEGRALPAEYRAAVWLRPIRQAASL